MTDGHLNILEWIISAGATFNQVRLDGEDQTPVGQLTIVKMFDNFSDKILRTLSNQDFDSCKNMLGMARQTLIAQPTGNEMIEQANRGYVLGLINELQKTLRQHSY